MELLNTFPKKVVKKDVVLTFSRNDWLFMSSEARLDWILRFRRYLDEGGAEILGLEADHLCSIDADIEKLRTIVNRVTGYRLLGQVEKLVAVHKEGDYLLSFFDGSEGD